MPDQSDIGLVLEALDLPHAEHSDPHLDDGGDHGGCRRCRAKVPANRVEAGLTRLREALRVHYEALYHDGSVTPQERDDARLLLEGSGHA